MINIFALEREMISRSKWRSFYNEMPAECRKIIEKEKERPSGLIGLGHNEEVGYFVLMSGQGPFICWAEKLTQEEIVEANRVIHRF